MSKKVCCPNCESENVRSIDNQPVWHPTKQDIVNGVARYDNEIYVSFVCDDCSCSRGFTIAFDIVPKKKIVIKFNKS